MIYKFVCPNCGKETTIRMPASQYDPNGHMCECGAELKRDIKDYCTISQRNVDGFFGVSTEN